ncbi:MAG: type I-G CRISPR-associated protein, Cas3-extension family [Pseudonocardiaceae bacterium]
MTREMELPALDGTNPLGFLAALGVLDVLHRAGLEPTVRWTSDLVPVPVYRGVPDSDELVELIDADRARWRDSVVLRGPENGQLDDVKPPPEVHHQWATEMMWTISDTRADADLFCALLSEGAVDGKGNGKPTHLHFTAGQQKFLVMVRELASRVDAERIREALFGPWREDSPLPTLSWNSQGERIYALRAINPSSEKRLGVPGADWLAFLGLVFFPTCAETRNTDEHASLRPESAS